ncbi:MAG: DUF1829 domain-containing protein [bacterium]|nr:DUF1829 domain-containing protein [bacterium]
MNQYWDWLKDKTVMRQVEGYVEISSPFLDRHNDYVQIYVKREDGGYILTDDGYTLEDLRNSGCPLDSPKRQDLFRTTVNGFGVQLEGSALIARATESTFALRKHNLVQAMLAVNDLFYLARPFVTSLFLEDVAAWLDMNEIRYTPQANFTGKSGYNYLFDFVIPKSRRQPERILQTINRPTHERAKILAFSWVDTKEVRPPNSLALAILNDQDQPVAPAIIDALREYVITPVLFSQRQNVVEQLAA